MTTTINVTCRCCQERTEIFVKMEDFRAWQNGKLVQDAMPYLSAAERELLISRTCSACFDAIFGGDDTKGT